MDQAITIVGTASALPKHRYPQRAITAALEAYWGDRLDKPELLARFHSRVGVAQRHLAFPLERYAQFSSWGETNAAWLNVAEELGECAIEGALAAAGLSRRDLYAIVVVSITGIASPSLDARLINRMGLRRDIRRTPIFGVGCVGGALGLSRAADYVRAYPEHNAMLLAVEACSLTIQRDDLSTANLIASGLFGDGAGAAIVAGSCSDARHAVPRNAGQAMPQILASESAFYPDSEDVMGWDISERGFKIVLSPRLGEFIRARLGRDIDEFLGRHGLRRGEIGSWVIHTGGPKVLEAVQDSLELPDQALGRSWECLRRVGNLSSPSVLLVLEDTMTDAPPAPGTIGLLLAMGPGFCSEMILLRW
jgi:alkylresorcinol/alkylpyrone synthase